jgi:hypothetical protein
VRDIDSSLDGFKDLFFFHLVENGLYLSRRGYVALSLPIGRRAGYWHRAASPMLDAFSLL